MIRSGHLQQAVADDGANLVRAVRATDVVGTERPFLHGRFVRFFYPQGGAVFAIKNTVDIPVKFIGVGEQIDDMEPFDADMFVRALLEMEDES